MVITGEGFFGDGMKHMKITERFLVIIACTFFLDSSLLAEKCKIFSNNDMILQQEEQDLLTTIKAGKRWFTNPSFHLETAVKKITSACSFTVFNKLLKSAQFWDWPLVAYQNAVHIPDTFGRDAFLYAIKRATKVSWQEAVYKTAAEIDHEQKLVLFQKMIDHAIIHDYSAAAYRALNKMQPHQFSLFERIIINTSYFNWKDEVFEALLTIDSDHDHKTNYRKKAFTLLIEQVDRYDWPVAAYNNIKYIDSKESYLAYKDVVEKYPLLTVLSTSHLNRTLALSAVGAMLATKLTPLLAVFGANFNLLFNGFSVTSIMGLKSIAGSLQSKLSALSYEGLKTALKKMLTQATGGIGALTAVKLAAISSLATAIYPHLRAALGYETGADVVFATAANIKTETAHRIFSKMLDQVRYFDWQQGIYHYASSVNSATKERRFNELLDHTAAGQKLEMMVFATAVSDELDKGEHTTKQVNRESISVTWGEKALTHLLETGKSWPEATFLAVQGIKTPMSYSTLDELVKNRHEVSKDIFADEDAMNALGAVSSEFGRKAFLHLIKDKDTLWNDTVYQRAVNVGTQQELIEFQSSLHSGAGGQKRDVEWGAIAKAGGIGLAALAMLIPYLPEQETIPLNPEQTPATSSLPTNSSNTSLEALSLKYSGIAYPKGFVSADNPEWDKYLVPNEQHPINILPHLNAIQDNGYLVSTGTERAFIALALCNRCRGLIGRDINPNAKLYNDFNLLLIAMAKDLSDYLRLRFKKDSNPEIRAWIQVHMTGQKQQYYLEQLERMSQIFRAKEYSILKKGFVPPMEYLDKEQDVKDVLEFQAEGKFKGANYLRDETLFLKLQAFAKRDEIIFSTGDIYELGEFNDVKIVAVDSSNIYEYVLKPYVYRFTSNPDFRLRVIWTKDTVWDYHSYQWSLESENLVACNKEAETLVDEVIRSTGAKDFAPKDRMLIVNFGIARAKADPLNDFPPNAPSSIFEAYDLYVKKNAPEDIMKRWKDLKEKFHFAQ